MFQVYLKLKKELNKYLAINIIVLSRLNFYTKIAIKNDLKYVFGFIKQNNPDINSIIFWSAKFGKINILKKYCRTKDKEILNKAVKGAAFNGQLAAVQYLYLRGADVKCQNNYCIRLAMENKHYETVKYLFLLGCDITAENNYCIYESARPGATFLFCLFEFSRNNFPAQIINKIILKAILYNNIFLIDLISQKYDLTKYVANYAAKHGRLEIMKILREKNCWAVHYNTEAIYIAKNYGFLELYYYLNNCVYEKCAICETRAYYGN